MIIRFLFYGFLGWITEIFWTSLSSAIQGDWTLEGHTYLWMMPIYGMAVFLEPIHDVIQSRPWFIRGFVWLCFIYATI